MSFNYAEDHVWIRLDKYRQIQGVYAEEKDCIVDSEYLGNGHSVQQWAIDFQTVAVEE